MLMAMYHKVRFILQYNHVDGNVPQSKIYIAVVPYWWQCNIKIDYHCNSAMLVAINQTVRLLLH